MISFCKDEAGTVMYRGDTYLKTDMFVIERPATAVDAAAHPDEHEAFVASTIPAPAVPTQRDETALANPEGTA